jgi:hypothetical protein
MHFEWQEDPDPRLRGYADVLNNLYGHIITPIDIDTPACIAFAVIIKYFDNSSTSPDPRLSFIVLLTLISLFPSQQVTRTEDKV